MPRVDSTKTTNMAMADTLTGCFSMPSIVPGAATAATQAAKCQRGAGNELVGASLATLRDLLVELVELAVGAADIDAGQSQEPTTRTTPIGQATVMTPSPSVRCRISGLKATIIMKL